MHPAEKLNINLSNDRWCGQTLQNKSYTMETPGFRRDLSVLSLIPVGLLTDLALLGKVTEAETAHLQELLHLLHDTLGKVSAAMLDVNLTSMSPSVKKSQRENSLWKAQHALLSCKASLSELSQATTDPSQSLGERKSALRGWRRALAADINRVTLIGHYLHHNDDAGVNFVEAIQDKMEAFCSWLLEQDLLPDPMFDVQRRDHRIAAKSPIGSNNKFDAMNGRVVVRVLDVVSTPSNMANKNSQLYHEVCPQAILAQELLSGYPFVLKLRCGCATAEHTDFLTFHSMPSVISLPVLDLQDDQFTTWQMVLIDVNRRPVSVQICVRPKMIKDMIIMEALWSRFACNILVHLLKDDPQEPIDGRIFKLCGDNNSILSSKGYFMKYTENMSHMIFYAGNNSFELPFKESLIQLLHYACIDKAWVSAASTYSFDCRFAFTNEDRFSIFISEASPHETTAKKIMQSYTIQVSIKTSVIFDGKSRVVSIHDVDCFEGSEATEQVSKHCEKVEFVFLNFQAAKDFCSGLACMKNLLLKNSIQGPVVGQTFWFQREVVSNSLELERQTPLRITILKEKDNTPQDEGLRVILSRKGCHDSVCFSLQSTFFEKPQQEFVDIAGKDFWTFSHNEAGHPVLRRSTWRELLEQKEKESFEQRLYLSPVTRAGTAALRDGLTSSASWFQDLEDVTFVLKTPKNIRKLKDGYRPIKIGVIDTGIDESKDVTYKDFVDQEQRSKNHGEHLKTSKLQHGTQSIRLIWKMYEEAELFVARVFENDMADEKKEPYMMAEAIRWLISERVDIISISAGFKTCPEPLRSAIHEAHAAHILVFAAASNWGNTDQVAFPARIKDHAFCIFATTGALKSARDINPEPRRNADNFAILGQDIELEGHSELVSGTSAATALAAGLAARLLDFVRHTQHQNDIKGLSLLHPEPSKAGMTAVFRALVRSSEKYDCLQPRLLLQDDSEDLEASRAHVRTFLSGALKLAE